METPKMDVVRFKEADVLAASPVVPVYHDTVTIANLGNSDFSDNYANAMNQDFSFDAISKGQASHLLHLDSLFNIGGNNFRLVAVVIFIAGVMNIRFIGTHAEYDKIDSATI